MSHKHEPHDPGTLRPSISDLPTQAPSGEVFTPIPVEQLKIPGYEILSELGRGGMGVVYKGRQTQLKRLVALKMILIGVHKDPEMLSRFRTEAEAVARFHHANIVQIYEIGISGDVPYFSMEFVEGGNLSDYLKHRWPPPREAAQFVEQLARAIDEAHRKSIIHRDLKPANILLSAKRKLAEGDSSIGLRKPLGEYTPKITDFRLAKNLAGQSQTMRGKIMGTPSYMAPEQAGGHQSGQIGPAADIYALGAILYQMLTGRPPFLQSSSIDTLVQVTTAPPVPPRQIRHDVPRNIEAICLKCLAKTPRERYPSALAMADDLQRFLEGGRVVATPVAGSQEQTLITTGSPRPNQGSRGLLWFIMVLILAILAGIGYFFFLR